MGRCAQFSLPPKAMESFKVSVRMFLLVGLAQSAPQNTNEVVRTVTTQLQPLISDAVARALAGLNTVSASSSRFGASSSGFGSSSSFGASSGAAARGSGLSEEEELEYNRKLSENAAYEYGYKVANDESQTYMAHEETRDGANVQGKYNYVDSTGALVTVTYQAGPEGYTETRDVQEGAVEMRNIPGPWTGPLAGVDNTGVTSVKTTTTQVTAPVAPARPAVDQSALIRLILNQLQPQISSAVQTAISSSNTVQSRQVQRVAVPTSGSATALFAGDNSVRIQTPEFNIEY